MQGMDPHSFLVGPSLRCCLRVRDVEKRPSEHGVGGRIWPLSPGEASVRKARKAPRSVMLPGNRTAGAHEIVVAAV